MRTKIIGHRGAAGLALENTIASIRAALEAGVDGVEIDLRLTKDLQVVVFHDANLSRLSQDVRPLNEIDLKELKNIKLLGGHTIPTLSEAIEAMGDKLLIAEVKDDGMSQKVVDILNRYPSSNVVISSFKYHELQLVKHLRPKTKIFPCVNTNPFEGFYIAKALESTGITLNFWILNPLTYFLSNRNKLSLMVYTVNNLWFGKFLTKLYPRIEICTNYPRKFIETKRATLK
jgi:glycerophosphoryl diester phosphodiesterase